MLTWNIGRVHLGARWGVADSRAADEDLPLVARGIADAAADVVALQELARPSQIERLLAHLGDDWAGAIAEREGVDRRTAVLARRALGPAFSTVTTATGRSATALCCADLVVLSFHCDAFLAGHRAAEFDDLVAFAARAGVPALLAGDLNVDLDHPSLGTADDRDTAHRVAACAVDLGRAAGPTALLGRRLDYVLALRPGLPSTGARTHGRLRLPLGDHLPLSVDVLLSRA